MFGRVWGGFIWKWLTLTSLIFLPSSDATIMYKCHFATGTSLGLGSGSVRVLGLRGERDVSSLDNIRVV